MSKMELLTTKTEASTRLDHQIHVGTQLQEQIANQVQSLSDVWNEWRTWVEETEFVLNQVFIVKRKWYELTPAEDFKATLSGPINSAMLEGVNDLSFEKQSALWEALNQEVSERLRKLKSYNNRVEFLAEPDELQASPGRSSSNCLSSNAIFVVHGRDKAPRLEVQQFIERCTNCKPIILSDQPNQGRDLLGKFQREAETACFAVVIMSGDDEGRLRASEGEPRPRARQNVIFELGYFIGLLGREKVAVLYESNVEIPSDFGGVVYIQMDQDWKFGLSRELKEAKIEVDLNKA